MSRDYSIAGKYFRFTDDFSEMEQLGRRLAKDYPDLYTPLMMEKMYEGVENHIPEETAEKKESMVYRSIYDYWAYGCNVDEEFYLHFNEKNHAEKSEYLVGQLRCIYCHHLNSGGGPERVKLMGDKYCLYQKLKPYFKREMISISDEGDYPAFDAFVKRHNDFIVKPIDFYYGIGVHKASLKDYNGDTKAAFDSIRKEGIAIKARHPSRDPKMVLEELIVQDDSLAILHPNSVNAIRATAVRGKDGKIHLFHPWIKAGINGAFVASAALDGFDAEIDPETGIVITDGYQEGGQVYQFHPNSGIQIKGFVIPKWNELIQFVEEIMGLLPEYGYVGWDLVLTPNGWCIMEGNYFGEFTFQLINGRGMKKEFENLIGWKYEHDYWWDNIQG